MIKCNVKEEIYHDFDHYFIKTIIILKTLNESLFFQQQ